MSPRTPEEFGKIRQQKKELIKQVALELFADFGFHNTSIEKITKKAGISKGLIYNYFTSKEDLLNTIIDDFFEDALKEFDSNNDGILSSDEFFHYIENTFSEVQKNLNQWRLFYTLSFQKEVFEVFKTRVMPFYEQIYSMIEDFFKAMNCENPQEEMLFFSSLIEGTLVQYIFMPEMFPIDILKNKIINYYKEKFKQ